MYELIQTIENKLKNLNIGQIYSLKTSYKDIKAWVDIADWFQCKLLVPIEIDEKMLLVKLQKLDVNTSFHNDKKDTEKYGVNSRFSKINKNKQPAFLLNYLKALENVALNKRIRILNLGVNSGAEFEIIEQLLSSIDNHFLLGIDYCDSAIKKAQQIFKHKNINFINYDINNLDDLYLEPFDLIITIGTLQSATNNFNKLFMNIVQNLLKKDGAIIMGFPNCRWIDDQMIYGAIPKNYNFSEMSILYKDVLFCKKYLQQKKFRVTITGKEYIFLTATSIR